MNTLYYGDILSIEEIGVIGTILEGFINRDFNYQTFVNRLKALGFSVSPNYIDYRLFDTEILKNEFRKRKESSSITPCDVKSFMLFGKGKENIELKYDLNMLKSLAMLGNPKAIKVMEAFNIYAKNGKQR